MLTTHGTPMHILTPTEPFQPTSLSKSIHTHFLHPIVATLIFTLSIHEITKLIRSHHSSSLIPLACPYSPTTEIVSLPTLYVSRIYYTHIRSFPFTIFPFTPLLQLIFFTVFSSYTLIPSVRMDIYQRACSLTQGKQDHLWLRTGFKRVTRKLYSRSIVHATLEVIQKRRTGKSEVHDCRKTHV